MKKILKKYFSLVRDSNFPYDEEIVKSWDEHDAAFEYVKSECINVTSYGNMEFPYYCFASMTDYKEHGKISTDKDYIIRYFTLKEDTIKKYNLQEVDNYLDENHLWPVYHMLEKFNIPFINIKTVGGVVKHYTNLEKLKKLIEVVNVKQQPLVIEGTDWPYWFNFEGELIPSKTSNWFKYLQTTFDYISPTSLVSYTGEDMYDKHLNEN